MQTRRRAVLVGRVSRGERQQDPENQLLPLRGVAARLGWEVVEEISLVKSAWDETAAAEVRRRVLQPIVDGRADLLAVWALDRICRGGIEAAFSFLAELEQHLGADFYSLQEGFLSTAGSDRQTRELMIAMLAWVAKWESQRKSERLKAKVRTRRTHAAQLGQRATWGRGKLASDADVAKAHQLKASGASVREIARQLGLSKSVVGRLLILPAGDAA